MDSKGIIEGNDIIGNFIGMKKTAEDVWTDKQTGTIVILGEYRPHKDWNELMPVVEKIGEFGVWNIRPGCVQLENWRGERRAENRFKFTTMTMDWETEFDEPIEFSFLVWHICLKFIQWLNSQNPQQ